MLGSVPTFAQIGIGTKTPAPSAALEVSSTSNNKGILIPRVTASQKDAIVSPAEGLLIYQTTAPIGFYYFTGSAWKLMAIQTDVASKVDKVDGKGLSSNDYTNAEQAKLAAITGTNTGDQTTIIGNAGTATKLAASKNINGVAFDGSADITVPAAAGTLTGIVAIANGGTNSTAVATTGGIGYGTGTAHAYTGTGTSGQLLSSNGAGVPTWVTPSGVSVPYTGAIAAVDLGAYDLKVNDLTVGKGGGSIASNTAIGLSTLFANTTGSSNTATGAQALNSNTTGSSNTAIGYGADVATGALTNATAIGAGAIVSAVHTIQLGNTSVLNVKTSGTVTAGAVTYPNIPGSNGQVLTSAGDGTSNWTSGGLPTADAPGQMLFWNGNIWVKVGAGNEGATLIFTRGKPTWSLAYGSVTSATGKIWMDRNLGASQVATSITDAASYGDLYQWGRGTDGHQFRASATTTVLSSIDQPDNSLFIKVTTPNLDWRSSQNNNLWQGLSGVNNPCPSGYRLPTEIEFNLEIATWPYRNPFGSPLKWTMGGYRSGASGELKLVDERGYYFTGTASLVGYARGVGFSIASNGYIADFARAGGFSVRCIKD